MIDFKEELSKFKRIELENEENEQIETDKESMEAVNCYNKALDQFEGGLDDMARANLRRAITLRPDFSYAISLLSLHLLDKGDRLGVVKLTSGIQDNRVKAEVMPYIDYLFTKYDKVEAAKDKKTTQDVFTRSDMQRQPAVYINDNGRTAEKKINNPPFERTRKKPFEEKTNNDLAALFDARRDNTKESRKDNTEKTAGADRSPKKESLRSNGNNYGTERKNASKTPFETSEGQSDLYEVTGKGNLFGESTDRSSVRSPERQTRTYKGDTDMPVYTKEEIKKHRLYLLAGVAVLVVFIVLLIIIVDLASQNRELRKRLEEAHAPRNSIVTVEMSDNEVL